MELSPEGPGAELGALPSPRQELGSPSRWLRPPSSLTAHGVQGAQPAGLPSAPLHRHCDLTVWYSSLGSGSLCPTSVLLPWGSLRLKIQGSHNHSHHLPGQFREGRNERGPGVSNQLRSCGLAQR